MNNRQLLSSFSIILCGALMFSACSSSHPGHHHGKKIPPGQAKKMTGSKSAKPYAPGQQKKKNVKY